MVIIQILLLLLLPALLFGAPAGQQIYSKGSVRSATAPDSANLCHCLPFLGLFTSDRAAACPRNLGLWDQCESSFIQQNLSAVGETMNERPVLTGAASIGFLPLSPPSTGQFIDDILSACDASAPRAPSSNILDQGEFPGTRKAAALQCDVSAWNFGWLPRMDQVRVIRNGTTPCTDRNFLPESQDELRRKATPKPLMTGVTKEGDNFSSLGNTCKEMLSCVVLSADVCEANERFVEVPHWLMSDKNNATFEEHGKRRSGGPTTAPWTIVDLVGRFAQALLLAALALLSFGALSCGRAHKPLLLAALICVSMIEPVGSMDYTPRPPRKETRYDSHTISSVNKRYDGPPRYLQRDDSSNHFGHIIDRERGEFNANEATRRYNAHAPYNARHSGREPSRSRMNEPPREGQGNPTNRELARGFFREEEHPLFDDESRLDGRRGIEVQLQEDAAGHLYRDDIDMMEDDPPQFSVFLHDNLDGQGGTRRLAATGGVHVQNVHSGGFGTTTAATSAMPASTSSFFQQPMPIASPIDPGPGVFVHTDPAVQWIQQQMALVAATSSSQQAAFSIHPAEYYRQLCDLHAAYIQFAQSQQQQQQMGVQPPLGFAEGMGTTTAPLLTTVPPAMTSIATPIATTTVCTTLPPHQPASTTAATTACTTVAFNSPTSAAFSGATHFVVTDADGTPITTTSGAHAGIGLQVTSSLADAATSSASGDMPSMTTTTTIAGAAAGTTTTTAAAAIGSMPPPIPTLTLAGAGGAGVDVAAASGAVSPFFPGVSTTTAAQTTAAFTTLTSAGIPPLLFTPPIPQFGAAASAIAMTGANGGTGHSMQPPPLTIATSSGALPSATINSPMLLPPPPLAGVSTSGATSTPPPLHFPPLLLQSGAGPSGTATNTLNGGTGNNMALPPPPLTGMSSSSTPPIPIPGTSSGAAAAQAATTGTAAAGGTSPFYPLRGLFAAMRANQAAATGAPNQPTASTSHPPPPRNPIALIDLTGDTEQQQQHQSQSEVDRAARATHGATRGMTGQGGGGHGGIRVDRDDGRGATGVRGLGGPGHGQGGRRGRVGGQGGVRGSGQQTADSSGRVVDDAHRAATGRMREYLYTDADGRLTRERERAQLRHDAAAATARRNDTSANNNNCQSISGSSLHGCSMSFYYR